MKYQIRDREDGHKIETFASLEEAEAALERYEAEDKADGVYIPEFYEIIEIIEIESPAEGKI